jgi:putative SOS response-associated peptidase YedK
MCYSSLAEKDFKKLNHEMGAIPWPDAFDQLEAAQNFETAAGPESIKSILGLTRKPQATRFKYCADDGRFYPNWFAPVIIQQEGAKRIVPMRYRIRPHGSSKEIPTKYNMYNAKIESLLSAHNWQKLIGRNHAVVAVSQFYEYVNKVEIGITSAESDTLKFAAIYDEWSSSENEVTFRSFAIITGPPPLTVAAIGHHRCPITLSIDEVDQWLSADNSNDAINLLNSTTSLEYKKAL